MVRNYPIVCRKRAFHRLIERRLLFGKTAQNTAVHLRRQFQAVFLADLIYIGGYDTADFADAHAFNGKSPFWGLKDGKGALKGMSWCVS